MSTPSTTGATRLLEPLTEQQQWVVDVIANAFWAEESEWPTFQYVEAQMDMRGVDLREVLATFPTIGRQPGLVYSALSSLPGAISANENQPLKVSLLGLWHCGDPLRPTARVAVADLLDLLNTFVVMRRSWLPKRTAVEHPTLGSADVREGLRARNSGFETWRSSSTFTRLLYRMMEDEPCFRGGHSAKDETLADWNWNIEREVLKYRDVASIQQYVERLDALFTTPVQVQRVLGSPLDLPASLGYLDTAWRLLHDRQHLLKLESPEKAASLAFDAGSREEFFDRLSALCDTMKAFQVPSGGGKDGHPLVRMRGYLAEVIPSEAHTRVNEALDVLGHLVAIRNGGEHGNAQDKAAVSWVALGVRLPVIDWPSAWTLARGRAISALDTLRDELLGAAE
jgi:hypothetical protein